MELGVKTFKALSSENRMQMLKELGKRRMTSSELAERMHIHVTTAKTHLDSLEDAGLVQMMDEGHKWKYYAVTGKGKFILMPYRTELKFLLASILFMWVGTVGVYMMATNAVMSVNYPADDIIAYMKPMDVSDGIAYCCGSSNMSSDSPLDELDISEIRSVEITPVSETRAEVRVNKKDDYTWVFYLTLGAGILLAGVVIGRKTGRLKLVTQ